MKGFKYPLLNAAFSYGTSLGQSNELVDEVGEISVENGSLVIIESRD